VDEPELDDVFTTLNKVLRDGLKARDNYTRRAASNMARRLAFRYELRAVGLEAELEDLLTTLAKLHDKAAKYERRIATLEAELEIYSDANKILADAVKRANT
jgi:ubiquinone biosynthesis protein UbiJ